MALFAALALVGGAFVIGTARHRTALSPLDDVAVDSEARLTALLPAKRQQMFLCI